MKPNTFVTKIDLGLADRLRADLEQQGFLLSQPEYTVFSGKKPGISCTLYASGKLLVQGKEIATFIEFYLEPEILKSFAFSYEHLGQDTTRRIGIDEAGKGDFFGPLCVAGVCAGGDEIEALVAAGVKDSKSLNDKIIRKLAAEIRKKVPYTVVRINPSRYNEMYKKFANLNHLLAWGHATAIENLMGETGCEKVVIDQFAAEHVVERALERKKLEPTLVQRTHGESDVVVAAASILARDAFVSGIEKLSEEIGVTLPKGANHGIQAAGERVLALHGEAGLARVAKMHFKTAAGILREKGNFS